MKNVRWMVACAVGAAACGLRCRGDRLAGQRRQHHDQLLPPVTQTPTDPTITVSDPAVALGGCPGIADPAGPADGGTINGPTGEYRVCVLPGAHHAQFHAGARARSCFTRSNGRTDVGYDCGPQRAGTVSPMQADGGATTDNAAVTLTIDPGVILFAKTGVSWLAVNRGNRINAVGTATASHRVHQPRQRAGPRHR